MSDHLPQCWTQDIGGMKRASAESCAVRDQVNAQWQERAERIAQAADTLARRAAGLVLVINAPMPPSPEAKAALESWVAQARSELVAAIDALREEKK